MIILDAITGLFAPLHTSPTVIIWLGIIGLRNPLPFQGMQTRKELAIGTLRTSTLNTQIQNKYLNQLF